jgi:hypothetical protein
MRREVARGAADFVFALALIWTIALVTAASPGKAFFVLSLTIAGMATFNLAFLRHLRRVYASPRRGVWRRV